MTRIGIISPYPGFSDVAQKVAKELGIEVVIEQAVLNEAATIAKGWELESKVSAVVARGLTAQVIKRRLKRLPVISIDVNGYDLMQALYRARQLGEKIAFIDYDYKEPPYDLDQIRAMLGFSFTPMLYDSRMGILRHLVRARRERFDVVVSTGVLAMTGAGGQALKAIMVQSSPAVIRDALLQAEAVLRQNRSAEYRDKRAQAVLETSRDGIIVINYRGRVTIFNPAAERILGLPASEVIHKEVKEVKHPGFVAIYGGGTETSSHMQMVDGREFVINRVPVLVAGQDAGMVITFQSANHIIRLEEMIRRQLHNKGLTARYQFPDILGRSAVLRETITKAQKFARSELTVLITGESGTGKELFAHAIHRYSPRSKGAFVAVNCAALPENLLESELFGYAEGAFTGARKGGKPGLFELAHGGTIFLDEIGELPITLQARLLRVLQSREVMRVGGDRIIPINVRVVAATNRQLTQAVQEGRFREDLYYRLNVLNLQVPPLRERPGDIRSLAKHFLQSGTEVGAQPLELSEECLDRLVAHRWMGNVRELRNFLMKFLILAEGEANVAQVFCKLLEAEPGEMIAASSAGPSLAGLDDDELVIRLGTMDEMEQQILRQLEQRGEMDRVELARMLGISRTTLWKKLKSSDEPFKN